MDKTLKPRAVIASLALMMAYGAYNYSNGYFASSVSEALGCTRAQYSLTLTVMSAVAVLTAPLWGRILKKHDVMRRGILVGAAVGAFVFFLYSRASSYTALYPAAALLGFVCNNCTMICSGIIINNAFSSGSGMALGLAMSGSGIGGAILGLIIPTVIERQGWRSGYMTMAVFWGVLLLLAFLLSKGLGESERTPTEDVSASDSSDPDWRTVSRSPDYFLLLFIVFVFCMNTVFSQHMPTFFVEMGKSPSAAGYIVTSFTLFLIGAKILMGKACNAVGMTRSTFICSIAFPIGMWLWLFSGGNTFVIIVGAAILSLGHSVCNVVFPLATRRLFGNKCYVQAWSVITAVITAGYAVGSPVWGWFYDSSGSYKTAVLYTPLSAVVCFLLFLVLVRRRSARS